MSVELRPFGVQCNLLCQYCYQNPQRDAGNVEKTYDLEAMKDAVIAEGGPFTMFGGEPLLMPIDDLEHIWAWGKDRWGYNSIQTNGALVTDRHIELFQKYDVGVGVSIDGPGELNDARWAGNLAKTRAATALIEDNIRKICAAGVSTSLIITLHRDNATAERLPRLIDWTRYMTTIGVCSIRLHLLETESKAVEKRYALTMDENIHAFRSFLEFDRREPAVNLDIFGEMRRLLTGDDRSTTCVWNACDPYTTAAVRGVEGNGQRSNCGRTNKEGIDFVKTDRPGFERYIALYHTPHSAGGCRDCRFFLMCKGQCPGTAIGHDWRNRTEHCAVWTALFEDLEADLLASGEVPLSVSPQRRDVETRMVAAWAAGENIPMYRLANRPEQANGLQTNGAQANGAQENAAQVHASAENGSDGPHWRRTLEAAIARLQQQA